MGDGIDYRDERGRDIGVGDYVEVATRFGYLMTKVLHLYADSRLGDDGAEAAVPMALVATAGVYATAVKAADCRRMPRAG